MNELYNTNVTILSPQIEPIKVTAMCIQQRLNLDDSHIMLGLENWKIPPDVGLYIALLYGTETVIGNANYNAVDSSGNYQEVQSTTMLHGIDIEMLSFDSSARLLKESVLQSVQSEYAQNLMNQNSMRLANTPNSFIAVPSLEPSKMLNRFHITIQVNAVHTVQLTSNYFDALQKVVVVTDP